LTPEDYLKVFERVAEKRGWRVNPDRELLLDFAKALIQNKEQYGIATCPCRLVTGKKEVDRLIICPCVYAEDDIREYGRCYCGLYLSREKEPADSVPDRHAKYYLEV
jgi:ferredoxin-thioredoxin reductase catalytic subunit